MFSRFGVRGRLLLSFVGISGFSVLAAAAAMFSFVEVQGVLDKITEQRVPTALAAQELSARVERIVAGTPNLLAAGTPDEQFEIWSGLGNEVKEVDRLLLLLQDRNVANNTLGFFQSVLDPLRSNLLSLNTLVSERITLTDRKAILLNRMRKANEKTRALMGSWITTASASIDEIGFTTEEGSTTQTEFTASVTLLQSLQEVQQRATEIQESLVNMSSAEDSSRLDRLMLRAQSSMEILGTLATEIETHRRELILAEIERFRQFIDDENSMPSLRTRELSLVAEAEEVLRENARLSGELTKSVESLVQGTRLDISQATTQARELQKRSSITLILVVSLSLASSVLIVWLYVGRNLIARLTELSVCMESVAGGDLKIDLPSTGPADEIGRMANALTIFRDTAVEIEENNLREIGQARQRLLDAIESISEGFCYYDSDDRLVVANSNYRTLMYPGAEDTVVEGMTFEEVIRNAAERGFVKDAENRVDEWVADRLARHRQPGTPNISQRGEGQWIMVSERRTGDRGTVAIYSDITELKQREEELAEKSSSMEQLSNQISKYLSPQVYESIFTGKREVKVASHRRKLSIFFSDIAGFTETADQLESEDLTKLLNHYLTEMSDIATEYGATIDKYVGDAIVIFFGDPETKGIKEDALACIKMAIAMRERLTELQGIWRDSGISKPLQCRIGINTGFCTVGNFGSEARMDYTIIGSGVNLASRLESAATPGEILISHETYALVKDQIHCDSAGMVELKGISHPVETYRVGDLHTKLQKDREVIREDFPYFNLEIDLDKLSANDYGPAVVALRRALEKVSRAEEDEVRKAL
jgi:class 3 adenylate cyclase/HAMP domain-containing protein